MLHGRRASAIYCLSYGLVKSVKGILKQINFLAIVPPVLGDLINLKTLILSSNQFSENLPTTLAGLRNLTDLSRGMFVDGYWYWICVGALKGFSLLFNICFIVALVYLDPVGDSKSVIVDEDDGKRSEKQLYSNNKQHDLTNTGINSASNGPMSEGNEEEQQKFQAITSALEGCLPGKR